MRCKKASVSLGFSLIEVMFALMIIAIGVSTLMTLQSTLVKNSTRSRLSFERIGALQNLHTEAVQKGWRFEKKPITQKNEENNSTFTYEVRSIPEASVLGKIKKLKREIITAENNWGIMSGRDTLVHFVFVEGP